MNVTQFADGDGSQGRSFHEGERFFLIRHDKNIIRLGDKISICVTGTASIDLFFGGP